MMLLRLGLDTHFAYTIIGVTWVAAFFVVRILPSPYLFFYMVNGNYAAFSAFEFWTFFFTTPLPFMLNSYWFYLLFVGIVKFLNKKNLTTEQQRERLEPRDGPFAR